MLNLRTQILDVLKEKGPSLPVQVAKSLERDIIFAGAVLSELVGNKVVKITTAKVGGSPLYYLPDQLEKIQVLYNHLPMREKEAFNLLKEKKFMYDKDTPPAIRVAFRMLKDFAKPIEVNTKSGKEIAWYWYLEDPHQFIKTKPLQTQPTQQLLKPVQQQLIKPTIQKPESFFMKNVENYLTEKNITITDNQIIRKNTESHYTITLSTQLGNLNVFVCAKNKKKISDTDLTLAVQQGQEKKMLTLFITSGELTKKAKEYLEKKTKGLLIFRRIE